MLLINASGTLVLPSLLVFNPGSHLFQSAVSILDLKRFDGFAFFYCAQVLETNTSSV